MGTGDGLGSAALLAELRHELKRQGKRVGELAETLGVAEPTVWRWLRGDGLSLKKLDQICGVLGIDLRDLVERASDAGQDSFTLAQERILAADRGLALVFFVILHGGGRPELEGRFGMPAMRVDSYLERLHRLGLVDFASRGRVRARTRRSVRSRPGGPLSVAFERTVKQFFLSMDFGSPETQYVSDMVRISAAGRARVRTLFESLREDIHLIGEQDRVAAVPDYDWSGVLMFIRALDVDEISREWRPSPPE